MSSPAAYAAPAQTGPALHTGRIRSLLSFLLAFLYFYFARQVAAFAASGFTSRGNAFQLVSYLLLLFLKKDQASSALSKSLFCAPTSWWYNQP